MQFLEGFQFGEPCKVRWIDVAAHEVQDYELEIALGQLVNILDPALIAEQNDAAAHTQSPFGNIAIDGLSSRQFRKGRKECPGKKDYQGTA